MAPPGGPPLSMLYRAARELGPRPLWHLARYRAALSLGLIRRRTPVYAWGERPLETWLRPGVPSDPQGYLEYRKRLASRFLFEAQADPSHEPGGLERDGRQQAASEADEILRGEFRLFGGPPVPLGFPPDWNVWPKGHGADGHEAPHEGHWTDISLRHMGGDARLLWEASRFAWVFPLVRAYRWSGDARYAEGILSLVASWRESNPPNAGPHWISAQEVALRLMALTFAVYGLADLWRQRPDQLQAVCTMIAVHAQRIPPTLSYARAQRNNHLLVEAAGLYTAGLLFPEFREADRWHAVGRKWLLNGLQDQVYPDGGYVQYSANYHRLALEAGLWALRLAERSGDSLAERARPWLSRMAEALRELIDRQSGKVPNLGPNDGAHLLRLSACPFEDFRPVVQASHVILKRERLLAPGPWDEALFWLGAEDGTAKTSPTAGAASTQPRQALPDYGIHFLRGEQSWAALRCVRFRSRPGHSDQLHLDLWWRGVNVALDAGSYLYNGQPPWDHGLAAADVHNTILVDGREPMLRAGPFLWLGRDRGRVLGHWRTESGGVEVVAGEHRAGAPRHIRHRRTVLRCGDRVWCVADDVIGRGDHDLRLSWLIPDGHWTAVDGGMQVELGDLRWAVEVQAEGPILALYRAGTRIWGPAIGGESPVWGWHSPTYSVRVPALHLKVLVRKELPQRLITVWTLGGGPREVPKIGWRAVGQAPVAFEWVEFGGERLRV